MSSFGTPQRGGGAAQRGSVPFPGRGRGTPPTRGVATGGNSAGQKRPRGGSVGATVVENSNKRTFSATDMASSPVTPSPLPSRPEFNKLAQASFSESPVSLANSQVPTSPAKMEAEPEENKPDFSNSNALVTFLVGKGEGQDQKKFTIHKDFACSYSDVLKAAFNSTFIEGQRQEYRFEDSSEGTIHLLILWLYHRDLYIPRLERSSNAGDALTRDLTELWVLADELLIPRLQNVALKGIHRIYAMTHKVPFQNLAFVYERTTSDSPLRRFFVALIAATMSTKWLKISPKQFPQEMLLDLATVWGNALQSRGNLGPSGDLAEFCVPEK